MLFDWFKKTRPVKIDVIENSSQEQNLMDVFNKHHFSGIECELGCLFGRTAENGEYMNRYIMKRQDFEKYYSEIKQVGKLIKA